MRSLSLRQKALAVLLLVCLSPGARAAAASENAYDTLGKLLHPFAEILAEQPGPGGNRALSFSVRVESSRGYPVDLVGAHGELAVEYPDKLRLHAPWFGEDFTICRRGEQIWVYPGSKLRELLARPDVAKHLPAPNRSYRLHPFGLPVPEKDLVFLPALFKATPATAETIDGAPCRTIDFQPTPPLAKSLGLAGWTARASVDDRDRLERIAVHGPATDVVVRVENLVFTPQLPPETWTPSKSEEGDVVIVPPARYDQLLRAIAGER